MVPVVSIVGKSNSGKTTLIERLIPMFKMNGYKVGAIKHDAHQFEIDHEGKDTWKMSKSGADTVAISSSDKMAMIKVLDTEKSIEEIVDWLFGNVDIVITEGYKRSSMPKIEVVRGGNSIITPPENNLISIVCNMPQNDLLTIPEKYSKIRKFNFIECLKIYEFIEKMFLKEG